MSAILPGLYIYIYIYDRTAMASGCTWMVRTHPCARNQDSAPSVDSLEREAEAVGPTAHDRFMLCVCVTFHLCVCCVFLFFTWRFLFVHIQTSPQSLLGRCGSAAKGNRSSPPPLYSLCLQLLCISLLFACGLAQVKRIVFFLSFMH